MPKVPGSDYVSSQQVPGSAPFEQATGVAFGQAADVAAEKGFKTIEAEGMLAQRHVQYVEAENARRRQINDVLTSSNTATEKILKAENDLQLGYKNPDGTYVPGVSSKDYVSSWQQKFKDISDETLSGVTDPGVKAALQIRLKQMYDGRLIQANHYSQVQAIQEQKAEDIANYKTSSTLAVENQDPLERNRIINEFNAALELKYGNTQPLYVQNLKEKFAEEVQSKYMRYLLRTDPIKFDIQNEAGAFDKVPPIVRTQIINEWVTANRQETARIDKLQKEHGDYNREIMAGRANYGALTANELERIRTGNMPGIKAEEYEHWRKWNETAPGNEGTQQVRALRDEYLNNLGYRSPNVITKYTQAATELGMTLGNQHPELTRFKEELKADWRASVNMDAAQVNRNVKILDDALDAEKKSSISPIMNNILKAREERMRGKARGEVRRGADPRETADKLIKERDKGRKQQENTTQGVIDSINTE